MLRTAPPSRHAGSPRWRVPAPSLLLFSSLFALLALSRVHADWPAFRGAKGDGVSTAKGIPTEWSETKNLQWSATLPGPGSSSPIIVGDKVFITGYSGYGTEEDSASIEDLKRHLICIHRHTGKEIWKKTVAAVQPEDSWRGYIREHGYASNTPVSDGEHVFVFHGKSGVYAYDLEGKELWNRNLGKGSSNRRWGTAASPILYQDKLIVNAGEESSAIYALEKASGKQLWKAEGDLKLAYGTPTLIEVKGGREDLAIAVPGEAWGLNPDSGKLRWYAETGLTGNVTPSVVFDGKQDIFVFGGYPRTGRYAIRIDTGKKGDLGPESKLWSGNETSYVPTPVFHDGHLYWVNDRGLAHCANAATGKMVYKERLPDVFTPGSRGSRPFYASTLLIGDKLYAVSRTSGTYVLEAKPEFKVVAHNKIAGDKSIFNGTPAVVDGQLLIRSNRKLYAIALAPDK